MNEDRNKFCPQTCPKSCPCPVLLSIAASIANEEESLACLLSAECAKVNKVVDAYSDYEVLIAIDTSIQSTLDRIITLENTLKAKLDSILPLISDCM